MKVGTKSILFGAHCFWIHPWFVAAAWTKLYGFPWDPRLWVAFFVHDLGYWGKPNMDGPEGEDHVWFGAQLVGYMFDPKFPTYLCARTWYGRVLDRLWGNSGPGKLSIAYPERGRFSWFSFCFYHSRFMSKRYGAHFSKLCVADKLALCLEPWWLYLPRVILSGEVKEYLHLASTREKAGEKYRSMELKTDSLREWHATMVDYLSRWVAEHKDLRPDTWTPEEK